MTKLVRFALRKLTAIELKSQHWHKHIYKSFCLAICIQVFGSFPVIKSSGVALAPKSLTIFLSNWIECRPKNKWILSGSANTTYFIDKKRKKLKAVLIFCKKTIKTGFKEVVMPFEEDAKYPVTFILCDCFFTHVIDVLKELRFFPFSDQELLYVAVQTAAPPRTLWVASLINVPSSFPLIYFKRP